MRCLASISRVALAVFVTGSVLPRAALVAHRHAGGEHAHVHGEDELAHEHAHCRPHHRHPRHGANPLALEAGSADAATHIHWQHPFQRADRPASPALAQRHRVAPLALAPPVDRPASPGAPARSRGPPASTSDRHA